MRLRTTFLRFVSIARSIGHEAARFKEWYTETMARRSIRQIRAPLLASLLMAVVAIALLAALARGSMRIARAIADDSPEDALLTYFPLESVLRAEILRDDGQERIYLVPAAGESAAATVWCEDGHCNVVDVDPLHE